MLGEAVAKNPGYLKLRKIRASQNIAGVLASSQNRAYLNAGSLLLNVNEASYDDGVGGIKRSESQKE